MFLKGATPKGGRAAPKGSEAPTYGTGSEWVPRGTRAGPGEWAPVKKGFVRCRWRMVPRCDFLRCAYPAGRQTKRDPSRIGHKRMRVE